MNDETMTVTAIEACVASALSAASDHGETAGARVSWTTNATAGVRVEFTDGRSALAEVWYDEEEDFAFTIQFEFI